MVNVERMGGGGEPGRPEMFREAQSWGLGARTELNVVVDREKNLLAGADFV